MAIPTFLSGSPGAGFAYREDLGVTDVSTIITNLGALLVANGWTLSGGYYYSPADSGWQINIAMTRTNAYTLSIQLCQGANQTIQLFAAGILTMPNPWSGAVRYFVGPYHIHLDVDPGNATPQYFYAGCLDLSPEAQNAHTHFAYGNATSTAGATNKADELYAWMIDNVTAAVTQRRTVWSANAGGSIYNEGLMTLNGSRIYRPSELWCIPTGGGANAYLAGRQYHCLIVSSAALFQGDEVTVPIDIGVTGVFKVCGGPPTSTSPTTHKLLAMRKS